MRLCDFCFVLALATSAGSCGAADEAIEQVLCTNTATSICAKWFKCWPLAARAIFTFESDCKGGLTVMCSGSELVACDINNDQLRQCNEAVQGTACLTTPASCLNVLTCYEGTL